MMVVVRGASRRVVRANTVEVNRLYSHVVEGKGRARPDTSNNKVSDNDDCDEDERFERDTQEAMKLSLMSMKNESKVMDVVPYGTVNGLRENVPMPYEDMDLVFTVHYMNYDDEDEKGCEVVTSTQKAGRYRQSIEKARAKQKRRQERKDSSKKETEKLQRKEKNKRRQERRKTARANKDEKGCEVVTSTQKAGRYRQSIEKARAKQKRGQERKDSSKKEIDKLQRKEENKRRQERRTTARENHHHHHYNDESSDSDTPSLASSDDDDSDTENDYDSENDSEVPTLNMTDDERGSEDEYRDEYDGEDIVGEVEVKKDVWALMNDRNENMRESDDGMRSIVVDNGCTRTLVGDLRRLSGRVKATKVRVSGVDPKQNVKQSLLGVAEGDLDIEVLYRGKHTRIKIRNALFVPGIKKNLLSVRDLGKSGVDVFHTKGGTEMFFLNKKGKVLAKEVSREGLYTLSDYMKDRERKGVFCEKDVLDLDFESVSDTHKAVSCIANTFTGGMNMADLIHARHAHISHANKGVKKVFKEVYGEKYTKDLKVRSFCEACIEAKATRLPFPDKARRKATRPLERVHFDIIGKVPVQGMRGEQYVLVFVDEKTGMYFAVCISKKSQVYEEVLKFKLKAEKHWRGKHIFGNLDVSPEIITLCSDGAGENTQNKLADFLDANQINHELMVPYDHEQMGLVERANRSIWEGAEAMRHHAKLPAHFWPDMVYAYIYIRNLMPNGTRVCIDSGKTPFEIWHNHERGDFAKLTSHLRVIGSVCYAFVPHELRNRTQKRVVKGYLVGYAKNMKAYIISSKNGVRFHARNVYFNETEMAHDEGKKSVADVIDDRMLVKFMKERKVNEQILDEIVDDDTIHDVLNIRPRQRDAQEKIDDREKRNDGREKDGDGGHDEENIYDAVMNDDVYDDEDYEIEHKHSDDEKTETTRRSSRQTKPSRANLESLANTPPGRNRQLRAAHQKDTEEANRRKRLAREANEEETEEIQVRIATADIAQKATETRAIERTMVEIREMIGKRIGILTDIEEHALVTKVHGADVPKTRKQMQIHKDKDRYTLGERKELEAFARLKVLEYVDRPEGKNVMKCGWVYDKKKGMNGEDVYKARLVAKGYSQIQGMDFFEVFSPTMQVKTLRTMLAMAANDSNVMTESWDVSTAFLHAPMDEEVYIEQPVGYEKEGKEKVCRMRKSMYGTKQASRNWHKTVHDVLTSKSVGFVQSKSDACLYMIKKDGKFVHVVIHVDDFAVFHNDSELCMNVYDSISKSFAMKRGPLTFFLGMRVGHHMDGSYSLDQEKYTRAILTRFNMNEKTRSASAPEMQSVKLSVNDCPKSDEEKRTMREYPYAALAGSVQYLVVGTRLDIAHACNRLCTFMHNPGLAQWNAGLRVLRYLKGTVDYKLYFVGDGMTLNAWSDADHAGCVDTRRSMSGYIVKIGNTAVAWQCKRQACVAVKNS